MPPLPAEMCIAAGDITDPLLRPGGGSVWAVVTRNDPDEGRSSRLVRWDLPGGAMRDVWDGPEPMSGRGLSGGVCAWSADGARFAVVTVDGPWWAHVAGDGTVHDARRVPVPPGHAWSGPVWSPEGDRLAIVADWSRVVVWDIVTDHVQDALSGPDFLLDPAWWGGGAAHDPTQWGGGVVAHGWSRPAMAWTRSGILSGVFDLPDAQAQQPRTSPDGSSIGFLTDVGGVLNLRIMRTDGSVVDFPDDAEAGGPTWGPGQRSWCWSPDADRVAIARNVDGFGVLSVVDVGDGARTDIGRGVHGSISWQGDTITALRTGARTPTQLVAYDVSGSGELVRRILATADPRWDDPGADAARDEMVEPEPLIVQGPGGPVPVRLHRARHGTGRLLCWVHGGPTDQWQVTFMPRLLFWLSRGYDIAVVDHRGTTGNGRAFMDALHGGWGRVDAEDLCAVAEHLHGAGGHGPEATAFLGASAGGLTALAAAAARPDLVAAVVCSYPVVDLSLLAAGDDPFETHYVPALVGDSLGRAEPVLDAAEALAGVPILVFHGDSDTAVPLEHTRRLVDAVSSHGGHVDARVMAGEGHGFRRRDNVLAEYAATEEHLRAHLAARVA